MTRWLPPILLTAALVATVAFVQLRSNAARKGFPAPDFALRDLQGRSMHLSDYQGKVVFLNLWATWCPPCREEMPAMERLFRRLRNENFAMLAVSEDENVATVQKFVADLQLSFPVLMDSDGRLPARYGVTGYPETFIIDQTGNVIQHIVGPEDWDSPTAVKYFKDLLHRAPDTGAGQRAAS